MSATNEIMVQRIKDACRRKGITVSSLEKLLGWSPGLISRWAKNNSPSIDKVIEISKELDVSIAYLVGESDESEKQVEESFEESILEATLDESTIWDRLLPDEMSKLTDRNINILLGSDKYDERVLYHFQVGMNNHYVLVVQWNTEHINSEENTYLKLFSMKYLNAYPILKAEDGEELRRLMWEIDEDINREISIADDRLSDIKLSEMYGKGRQSKKITI